MSSFLLQIYADAFVTLNEHDVLFSTSVPGETDGRMTCQGRQSFTQSAIASSTSPDKRAALSGSVAFVVYGLSVETGRRDSQPHTHTRAVSASRSECVDCGLWRMQMTTVVDNAFSGNAHSALARSAFTQRMSITAPAES